MMSLVDNREPVIDRKEEQYSYWENLKLKKGKTSKAKKACWEVYFTVTLPLQKKRKFHELLTFKFSLFPDTIRISSL